VRRGTLAVVIGLALVLSGCGAPDEPAATSPPPPTFVVPSSVAAPVSPAPSGSPSTSTSAGPAAKKVSYAFPVVGRSSYAHTHHDYPASDIITNCGNKVVAATSGTILVVNRKDTWKASVNAGETRGGLSVSLLGDDGVRYYGSHLSVIDAKIVPGAHVTTGQTLGKIGDTGDASACHLHFGISPPCSKVGDWWLQRGTVYPWPYLDAWRDGKNKSAVAAVAAWKSAHGCPKKPLADP
jgi:murein DD-endopeptidase MepM/ murein hydrolase activator NlpD